MALVTDSLTIPPAGSLNGTGKGAAARQLPAAASRAVVPLVYGEDRISGLILNVLAAAGTPGTLLVQVLWCFACDSINDPRLNDQALPAGATITHYTGAQTVADATLVAAFAAQGISGVLPLTGYAWSLLAMPAALFDGQINVTARVRGRRCYDPAFDTTAGGAGPQRLADPATWAYNDIPAVCLGDFISNTVYGCGQPVDWESVRITGAANRAIVPESSEQRRLVGVSFISPAPAVDMAETLRAYAGCFLLPGPTGVRLLPDANDAPVATYSHAAGEIATISSLDLRDLGQAPTAVEIIYTDTSAIPWRDASAVAQLSGAGTTRPWRLSQVRMPGIHRYSQAMREAVERLNKLALNDLSTSLEVFDIGVRHDKGDVITVTHPLGLAAEKMRVNNVSMPGPGRWELELVKHAPAAYSDSVATVAPTVDGSRLLPIAPPANVEGLVGAVSKGVITWRWTPSIERYYTETRLRIGGADWASATPLWAGRASQLVQQVGSTGTYLLRARHAVSDGQESPADATYSVTVTTGDLDATAPDLTPAPTPEGASVTAGFASLFFEHALPSYTQGHGHGKTRIYGVVYTGGAEPVISSADVLTEFTGTSGAYPTTLGTAWRIWFKWVTNDGVESVTAAGGSGTNGLAAQTGLIGGANIAPLAVTAAQLAADAVDLGSDKVTGTITDPVRFGAAAIGYTVTQYLVATSGVLGNLIVDNAQISNLSVAKLLGGTLSVSAYIQSQGYSAGVSGWRINADGSAEFAAASIRGQITADQFDGRGAVIRDNDGNPIFSVNDPLAAARITPDSGWLNSNVAIPRGTMNSDPGLLDAANSWTWDSPITIAGPSAAAGALGVKFFSASSGMDRLAWSKQTYPISSARTYDYSALLFAGAGNDRYIYLVVDMFDAAGARLDGSATGWGGSYAGYVYGGQPAVGQFTRYGAEFGAGTARPIPANAAYFRIGVWFQYSSGTSSVQQAAEDIRLVDITEARAAQVAADAAAAAADDAQDAADDAAADASAALGRLDAIDDDEILSKGEKPALIQEYEAAYYETSGIQAQGAAYGLTTLTAAYASAYNAWGTYLAAMTPAWNDTSSDTPIVPSTFRAKATDYFTTRQALLNAIADEAAKRADWAHVGGSGKPQDNATVGAQLGTNLKDSGGTVLGDGAVKNNAIAITVAADGTVSVSGGPSSTGQVTAPGIGAVKTDASNAPSSILNNAISFTVNSNGTLSISGGPTVSGAVTLTGLGAGALAALNQITAAYSSTYIDAAAINLAHINVASITTLGALSSFLGTVEIATGGYLRSGKTSFADTTAGFLLANTASVPQFHVGNADAWIKFSTDTGFDLNPGTFSIALSGGTITVAVANGTQSYGGRTVTVTGGKTPYSYNWSAAVYEKDPDVGSPSAFVSGGQGTDSAGISGTATNSRIWIYVTVQVTDANGRVKSTSYTIQATHGTYIP